MISPSRSAPDRQDLKPWEGAEYNCCLWVDDRGVEL